MSSGSGGFPACPDIQRDEVIDVAKKFVACVCPVASCLEPAETRNDSDHLCAFSSARAKIRSGENLKDERI